MGFGTRLKHAWNAFLNKDPTVEEIYYYPEVGNASSYRPDRPRLSRGNDRSIATSVLNRIAMDVAAIEIKHVRLDDNNRYKEDIEDGLNNCLTLEANIDQTARAFRQDVALSLLDEGCIAIVPVDTTLDPRKSASYDILTMRVGKIVEWYPRNVKVLVYNDRTGQKEERIFPKTMVSIIENPLYAVINEPNSTLQRLIRKLALLDISDGNAASKKLDLIIQLPYVIKTEARRLQAEKRRKDIENQLATSEYGIAYTDGTEHVVQLNRAVENNLQSQVEYLTRMLYGQLGLTQEIMDGSAEQEAMTNYNSRTVEPIISAIVDEMKRKFLSKTARSQKQSIMFFLNPFRLIPLSQVPEMADKLSRNEIMSSNEIRQILGLKPSSDPSADELRNKNLSQSKEELQAKGANGASVDVKADETTVNELIKRVERKKQEGNQNG